MLIPDTVGLNRMSQMGIALNYEQKKWQATIGYDYFHQFLSLVKDATSIVSGKVKYRMPKTLIDGGLKCAFGQQQPSFGWHFNYQRELLSFLDLTIRAEKFVRGNFYRNYYQSYFNRFPYLLKIGVKFKL